MGVIYLLSVTEDWLIYCSIGVLCKTRLTI